MSLACQWMFPISCTATFDDAEELHQHLCETHVGRKQLNNLCLSCCWQDCRHTQPFSKRDHIVSHIKRHVPLKTFVCPGCQHPFKWLHDMNQHLTRTGHGTPQKMPKKKAEGDRRRTVSGPSAPPARKKGVRRIRTTSAEVASRLPTFTALSTFNKRKSDPGLDLELFHSKHVNSAAQFVPEEDRSVNIDQMLRLLTASARESTEGSVAPGALLLPDSAQPLTAESSLVFTGRDEPFGQPTPAHSDCHVSGMHTVSPTAISSSYFVDQENVNVSAGTGTGNGSPYVVARTPALGPIPMHPINTANIDRFDPMDGMNKTSALPTDFFTHHFPGHKGPIESNLVSTHDVAQNLVLLTPLSGVPQPFDTEAFQFRTESPMPVTTSLFTPESETSPQDWASIAVSQHSLLGSEDGAEFLVDRFLQQFDPFTSPQMQI